MNNRRLFHDIPGSAYAGPGMFLFGYRGEGCVGGCVLGVGTLLRVWQAKCGLLRFYIAVFPHKTFSEISVKGIDKLRSGAYNIVGLTSSNATLISKAIKLTNKLTNFYFCTNLCLSIRLIPKVIKLSLKRQDVFGNRLLRKGRVSQRRVLESPSFMEGFSFVLGLFTPTLMYGFSFVNLLIDNLFIIWYN